MASDPGRGEKGGAMPIDAAGLPPALRDPSLEMTARDLQALAEAAPLLAPGSRVDITLLAGEDAAQRLAAASAVLAHGLAPAPHIAVRRLRSEAELAEILAGLRDAGAVEQPLVVGGDPELPFGPYPESLAVLRSGLLQRYGAKRVGIAGYPEGHPDIPDE